MNYKFKYCFENAFFRNTFCLQLQNGNKIDLCQDDDSLMHHAALSAHFIAAIALIASMI